MADDVSNEFFTGRNLVGGVHPKIPVQSGACQVKCGYQQFLVRWNMVKVKIAFDLEAPADDPLAREGRYFETW